MNFLNAGSDGEKTEKQNYFEAQIQGLSIQAEKDWKFTSYQAGIRYYKSTVFLYCRQEGGTDQWIYKKSQKTPKAEKELAKKYKADYERRYGNEQL